MPIPLTSGPGVYIQELPNPVRPIVGVPTSVAAFYGPAPQGRVDYPYQVNSWADYENQFGGLDSSYPLSYAVYLFFLNGGTTALVVRYNDPNVQPPRRSCPPTSRSRPARPVTGAPTSLPVVDQEQPARPKRQPVQPDHHVDQDNDHGSAGGLCGSQPDQGQPSVPADAARGVAARRCPDNWTISRRHGGHERQPAASAVQYTAATAGTPGRRRSRRPEAGQPEGSGARRGRRTSRAGSLSGDQNQKTGIYALLKADIFNILCLPVDPDSTYDAATLERRRPRSAYSNAPC